MKICRNYVLGLLTLSSFIGFAQVGINTSSPQEALHVAGASSTVRIEGLNSVNETNNLGGTDAYNVMIDANGNMLVGQQSGLINSTVKINTPIALQTTSLGGLNAVELYQEDFTITQRAVVVITYFVGIEFATYDGTGRISDGRAKIAHNYFYLGDGTIANIGTAYGMTSNVYANSTAGAASDQILNSRTEFIVLDPGTYSIHMQGAVYAGGLNSDAAFRAIFGNGDRLDISVIYI